MEVTNSAYVAVLENKLQQAERNLHEFRKIFTHWSSRMGSDRSHKGDCGGPVSASKTTIVLDEVHGTQTLKRNSDGSFPGQLTPPTLDEELFDPAEAGKSEAECIE